MNEQLKAARAAESWTQEETADRARISRVTYSRIEKGTQQPQEETIKRLCILFRRSREELGLPPGKSKRSVIARFLSRKW